MPPDAWKTFAATSLMKSDTEKRLDDLTNAIEKMAALQLRLIALIEIVLVNNKPTTNVPERKKRQSKRKAHRKSK